MLQKLVPDAPPPHVAHARLAARHATTFILESREGPQRLARYSIVGFDPVGTVLADADGIHASDALPRPTPGQAPMDYVRERMAAHAVADHTHPFVGGLVGSFGYDAARLFEPTLEGPTETWPRFILGLYLDGLVYDHRDGTATYVSRGDDRSAALLAALDAPPPPGKLHVGPITPTVDQARFEDQVRQAQTQIRRGEAFQIVLSRPYEARFEGSLTALYDALRDLAPVPYLFHLRFGQRQIVGASPEMLVRVRHGVASTFPIAGTRPRTGDAQADAAAAAELRQDRKERAEHAMLVDLARNDLGRVCKAGTIQVTAFQEVQPFHRVQHMVSRVEGELHADRDALAALQAVFPAGTVSGAPKVRAMEHIDAIEGLPRGAYAGAVAYASFNGDFDSAIAIRTLSAHGDHLTVQAGAGIVHRSDPALEFRETEQKASTLLQALRGFQEGA